MGPSMEILDPDLVHQRPDLLAFIDHWKAALGLSIGWHYDLDLIWILSSLDAMGLPRGASILDAGAGNGLLQFLLAAKGYRVDSADFADRDIPWAAARIFRISKDVPASFSAHDNRYREFIDHRLPRMDRERLLRLVGRPGRTARRLLETSRALFHPARWLEILRPNGYGEITYRTADFTDMAGIPSGTYDCVVSVSAIEHNDPAQAGRAIREWQRVTKPGGALLVTTSAALEDSFLEFCQGWCFSRDTLAGIFGLDDAHDNYADYEKLLGKLVANETIKRRIAPLYFEGGDNGLPYGRFPPSYQPVGVRKPVG